MDETTEVEFIAEFKRQIKHKDRERKKESRRNIALQPSWGIDGAGRSFIAQFRYKFKNFAYGE